MASLNLDVPTLPLSFKQGTKYVIPGTYPQADGTPANLNGYGMRIALVGGNANAVLLSLTTTNGRIVLATSAVSPNFTITILATDTETFADVVGSWDAYLDPNGVEDGASFAIWTGGWQMTPQFTP